MARQRQPVATGRHQVSPDEWEDDVSRFDINIHYTLCFTKISHYANQYIILNFPRDVNLDTSIASYFTQTHFVQMSTTSNRVQTDIETLKFVFIATVNPVIEIIRRDLRRIIIYSLLEKQD